MEAMNVFPDPRVLTGLHALDVIFGELHNTNGTRVGTMNMFVYKFQSQVEDTGEWVKKQELALKKKKGGVARAASLNGDSLGVKLGKIKYK